MNEKDEKPFQSKNGDILNNTGREENEDKKTNIENTNTIQKKEDEEKKEPFVYLSYKGESTAFNFSDETFHNIFSDRRNQYKYVICLLLQNDSIYGSTMLESTLNGINSNIESLKDAFNIEAKDILIVTFVNEVSSRKLIQDQEKITLKNNYLLSEKSYNEQKEEEKFGGLFFISKKEPLLLVESVKIFYGKLLKKFRSENSTILTSVITAGVSPEKGGLKRLILNSFEINKNHHLSVGVVEGLIDPKSFVSNVYNYERTHFNLYDMNYYSACNSAPVSSLLNVIWIEKNIFKELDSFYKEIDENMSIDFHDYYLGLYLSSHGITVHYCYDSPSASYVPAVEMDLADYKDDVINRYSGYYGNFFQILRFFTAGPFSIKKIFTIFQLIGILIDFVYPGLSTMVIYTIFAEAFDSYDIRTAVFFTILYELTILASGLSSIGITDHSSMTESNYFFYFFNEVYTLLIIICAIPAMDKVNKNKNHDLYKFNKAAISVLIIFIFIVGIIPILIKITTITKNSKGIANMFLYLPLGCPSANGHFHISQILNAVNSSGGKNLEDKQGIYFITFFMFNLFISCLTFFNTSRAKRVDAVMGLAIFYFIYLVFKTVAIANYLLQTKDVEETDENKKKVKNALAKSVTDGEDNQNEEDIENQEESKVNNTGENRDVHVDDDRRSNNNMRDSIEKLNNDSQDNRSQTSNKKTPDRSPFGENDNDNRSREEENANKNSIYDIRNNEREETNENNYNNNNENDNGANSESLREDKDDNDNRNDENSLREENKQQNGGENE